MTSWTSRGLFHEFFAFTLTKHKRVTNLFLHPSFYSLTLEMEPTLRLQGCHGFYGFYGFLGFLGFMDLLDFMDFLDFMDYLDIVDLIKSSDFMKIVDFMNLNFMGF